MAYEIVLVAFDECVGLSLHGPADLFSTANSITQMQGGTAKLFNTKIISFDGRNVLSSNGHEIVVDGDFSKIVSPAVIMLPGFSAESLKEFNNKLNSLDQLIQKIPKYAKEDVLMAATCTGTLLLGKSGMLDGKSATTTWWLQEFYQELFPKVELNTNEILVEDGHCITSAAGASSLDLTLHIIAKFAGPHLSRECAKYLMIDNDRLSQRTYSTQWHLKTRDPLIEKADAWIRNNLQSSCKVNELADHLGVSARTLLRRFQKQQGMTPQEYIQDTKMDQAKFLLESSDYTVGAVAQQCGFSDENAFRRSFTQKVQLSPVKYRKKFKSSQVQ